LTVDLNTSTNSRLSVSGWVIVHVAKNKVEFYRPIFGQIQTAVAQVKPGEVLHVYSLPPDPA
jgi:hypothetical protein